MTSTDSNQIPKIQNSGETIKTFGRRHGKKLTNHQQSLIDSVLPELIPKVNNITNVILEIGFGGGEHLLDLAHRYPDDIIIGAEPFINGVASLLSRITRQESVGCVVCGVELLDKIIKPEYKNIRIFPDDVRKLLTQVSSNHNSTTLHTSHFTLQNPNLTFSQIWILHPDPWPKARHEKRRLLNANFLNLLGNHLTENGEIIIGTDHHEYYDWVVSQLSKTNLAIKTDKLEIIKTRYQEKNKAGTIAPKYLVLTHA